MCLDALKGTKIWEHRFNVWLTDIVVARVGWTNLVGDPETGNVISHGTQGLLTAFDGKTGKILWERSLTEEFGRVSGYGGRLSSPIVEGKLVIVGMACATGANMPAAAFASPPSTRRPGNWCGGVRPATACATPSCQHQR